SENIWAQNSAPKVTGNQSSFHISAANAFVRTEFTSIRDTSGNYAFTAIKDSDYDKNGNVLEVREYDWVAYCSVRTGSGCTGNASIIPSGAVLKRKTTNSYYYPTPIFTDTTTDSSNIYANPSSPALKRLVKSSEVKGRQRYDGFSLGILL
ncbi:MAG: hypothetical protein ABI999_11840, partial [Acidobacteriota bacterium]